MSDPDATDIAEAAFYIQTDSDGVITGVVMSNVATTGIAVDQDVFQAAQGRVGRAKLQSGVVVDYQPPAPVPTEADVNRERSRRIAAGKIVDGVHVTGTDEDARNLTNLALAAQLRLAAKDTETLTTFRDGDNVDHDLTPGQILSLWQQSAAYVSAIYAASWALKALDPIPSEYAQDAHWPG